MHTPSEDLLLHVECMTYGGRGLARRPDGKVVFVDGALPGETVMARVTSDRRDFAEACVVQVMERSPLRTEPFCESFGLCGGCDWQHALYRHQVEFKRGILEDALTRAVKTPFETEPDVPSPQDRNYRCRATLRVVLGASGGLGFFARRSHEVVRIRSCPLLSDRVREIVASLERELGAVTQGRAVSVDVAAPSRQALVAVTIDGAPEKAAISRADNLRRALGIEGLSLRFTQSKKTWIIGSPHAWYSLETGRERFTMAFGIGGFVQANPPVNTLLVEDVVAKVSGSREVLDLFSGSGNFAVPLGPHASSVVAVEHDETLVRAGRAASSENKCSNVTFVRGDALRTLTRLKREGRRFDAVILDPPRKGARDIAEVLDPGVAPLVIYVSCNPSTLARDVSLLTRRGFRLESTRLYDMFPHTHHIESLTVLKS
ncbi:MAG TPA: class I SAM-dependent RNA methyltransferase [Deltaproteobacteria bacterium]|nr:class I SAM-dependent RNA methyltransferase [Deltaproteobacteria bacterium]HOM29392.1 class I SAM-dependent RNA methyltransferase [Deltaproteobacteria bacterium]